MAVTPKFDASSFIEANKKLEEKFNELRKNWLDKITDLTAMIKKPEQLAEVQVFGLSYRQIVLEEMVKLKNSHSKIAKQYDTVYKDLYRQYTLAYDIKLTGAEKEKFIRADLSAVSCQLDLLQNMIEYYTESIKTLDNINFAVKNRIQLIAENLI